MEEEDADAAYRSRPGSADEETPPWYFVRNGAQQGPVWLSELQRMAESMEIGPETLVWRNGMDQWTPGSEVVELVFPPHLERPAPTRGDTGATPGSGMLRTPQPDTVSASANIASGPSALASRKSILAIASPVMAAFWLCGLGSLASIAIGILALRRIGQSQGTLTGKRLAIAGIIVGILGLLTTLILLLAPDLYKASWR